jgi:two-component system cell cycle response regulator DivK
VKRSVRPQTEEPISAGGQEKKLVLVVDDYDDGRDMYAEYLRFAGYRVDVARDGQEALDKAQGTQPPDIILMDLSLPVVDGWEATRRLKQDERTRDIPVMAVSAHAMLGHAESAREAGADAFVPKPCLPQDVETKIRDLLKPRKQKAK